MSNIDNFNFDDFNTSKQFSKQSSNLDDLKYLNLEIVVEMGRSQLSIKDILNFQIGSVIELDKLLGEDLNILVNGKKIGSGEVVVVEDRFGIRIKTLNS